MRKCFLLLALVCMTMAHAADMKWALVTQDGQTVFMERVGYILNSDGNTSFTIVLNDNGTVDDVTKVSFAKVDATGIHAPLSPEGEGIYAREVEGQLTISGCRAGNVAEVYNTGGQLVRRTTVSDTTANVDVSTLASGIYILRIGNTAVKFHKK